jgi:hypothetical protein
MRNESGRNILFFIPCTEFIGTIMVTKFFRSWTGSSNDFGISILLASDVPLVVSCPASSFLPINSVGLKPLNYFTSYPSADALRPVLLYVNQFISEVLLV